MGLGGISLWQLLIILVIVLLLFGTKKLRNLGGDLGSAVKGFKSAMKDGEDDPSKAPDEGVDDDKDALKADPIESGAGADTASADNKTETKTG